jgi:hypothetical protein
LSNGTFQISTFRGNEQVNALDPQTYNEQIINAGFLNTEYNLESFQEF